MRSSLLVVLMLSACTSAPTPSTISDTMDADSGLVLSSSEVDGWQEVASCRPHLCHLHRMLTITAPDGESLIVLVAPSEADGKAGAVGMRSRGWDDGRMPRAVRERVGAFVRPR